MTDAICRVRSSSISLGQQRPSISTVFELSAMDHFVEVLRERVDRLWHARCYVCAELKALEDKWPTSSGNESDRGYWWWILVYLYNCRKILVYLYNCRKILVYLYLAEKNRFYRCSRDGKGVPGRVQGSVPTLSEGSRSQVSTDRKNGRSIKEYFHMLLIILLVVGSTFFLNIMLVAGSTFFLPILLVAGCTFPFWYPKMDGGTIGHTLCRARNATQSMMTSDRKPRTGLSRILHHFRLKLK